MWRQNHDFARLKLRTAHRQQKAYYDLKVHGDPYEVGDLVWLWQETPPPGQSRKFYRPWRGPFEVIEVLSPANCILRDPDDPNAAEFTAHFNKLKVYNADDPSTDTQDYLNVTRSCSDSYLQPIPDFSDDPS